MRRRKNILEFKRPRTIKDIEALWFVDYTEKDNDPYAPSWWIYLKKGFRLKTDETICIHEETLKEAIERLDDVYEGEWV
ncbi:hypothetical protein [uncultured Algoriphagus sp.]|uniref:hypothetical protein n=1 Tax=uncultured Algoriphagus sp. TaxID=417365 RepID=UPI0032B18625|tara:strand:- start:316 stop:552 length:237 start_codon:yes stop_codon:yes gene_type:complete